MTTPVIEAGDITTSVSDTLDADPATISLPSYNNGDLIIIGFATDTGSITHTLPTAGPNSETINTIVANNTAGGAGGPDSSAFWYVATANETTPTIDVTISANARWYAGIIVVPTGEFDTGTPIQANDGNTGSNTATTTGSTPTWTADATANGRVVGYIFADTQSQSGTASGWTVRENTDHGRVSMLITTRDAANTASESIAAADYTIDSTGDTYTSIGFIVNEPVGGDITVTPGAGSLSISSTAPTLKTNHIQSPAVTALTLAQAAPTIIQNHIRGPPVVSVSLSTAAPSAEITHNRQTGAGSASFASDAPSVAVGVDISVPVGALSLSTAAPSAETDHIRATGGDSLAFASEAPGVAVGLSVDPSVGAVSITGAAPSAEISHNRSTGVVAVSITGAAPVVGVGNPGVAIVNDNATTDVNNNYEICDFTGFRQLPGSLKFTWNKYAVRRKSWEERHPQDKLRARPDSRRKGSRRPEQDDRFIGTDISEITQDDL